MSYKEKPILKLYKYENNSFVLQAQIDDYQEVSWENNLYEAGQFSVTINYNIPNASLFERGLFINFGDSYEFGEILKIQDSIGEDGAGSQLRVITGYDARYILKRRVIKNMNNNGLWTMTGKGELVIRNLIADQAGANAEEKRRLPIVNTIPSPEDAIGKEYSASEQFSNLYEVCKTIATQSEVGWRIEFDGTSLTLVFFSGEDRSQIVRFDTSYESLANGTFVDSGEAFSNAIYVGGKGQNDDRDIYEGENAIEGNAPSGLDRFECWDNQSSMTTEDEYEAEALAMLTQYGQTLTLSGNGLAKCLYEYEKEYNVGDKITVAFSGKSAVVQILSVTEHWAFASYDLNFSFGKPQPDLNGQLQLILKQIQKASNKTNSKDSVRWYTIPTDTAMPASDVTYNTIGFIGNVGSGATFTLYRDSSGTGSKTYHIYFKQLSGSGKLTLTTGVSGASNLVMNPGTYVAIIYVDENGNITSQGMTATSSVSSGNSQPVTSGGVAEAIATKITYNRAGSVTGRYILLATIDGSGYGVPNLSMKICYFAYNGVRSIKANIQADIIFYCQHSQIRVAGITDINPIDNNGDSRIPSIIISRNGNTSYLYVDTTYDWTDLQIYLYSKSNNITFITPEEKTEVTGDIEYNERTDVEGYIKTLFNSKFLKAEKYFSCSAYDTWECTGLSITLTKGVWLISVQQLYENSNPRGVLLSRSSTNMDLESQTYIYTENKGISCHCNGVFNVPTTQVLYAWMKGNVGQNRVRITARLLGESF